MRQKAMIVMLALAAALLVRNLYNISVLPDETNQGQIFRIIFFHVPAAVVAMVGSAVALLVAGEAIVGDELVWFRLLIGFDIIFTALSLMLMETVLLG